MARLRKHLTYANVMSTIAVFGVLAGGTAYAVKVKLKNNSVTTPKIANGAVTKPKIASGAVDSARVENNSITGADLAPGTVGSSSIASAAQGARAYGRINSGVVLTRAKNIQDVYSIPSQAVTCIKPVAGIDPSTAGLVVTPDYTSDSTTHDTTPGPSVHDTTAHVEWVSSAGDCSAGYLEVKAFTVDTAGPGIDIVDTNGDHATAPFYHVHAVFQDFFFVIP